MADIGCVGVKLHDIAVRILLYADDGALVATSAQDLQHMFDVFKMYCAKWRMFVIIKKTKVMVFNNSARVVHQPVFIYNGAALGHVMCFKYLGVMFSNTCVHAHYKLAIEHRLLQSKRLVAAWMRRCYVWCFNTSTVVSQFKTCIMPALEYGVGLWGVGQYQTAVWREVEEFWRYIARCILGVSQRAPNGGVYGELGWFPFHSRAMQQATQLFTRVTKLNDTSLLRKAMYVQRDIVRMDKPCWLSIYRDTLNEFECGRSIWSTWWNMPDFRCSCLTSIDSVDSQSSEMPVKPVSWEEQLKKAADEAFISTWQSDLRRQEAKRRGVGGNKLRTYRLFKSSFETV
jgi:hypothetical protein